MITLSSPSADARCQYRPSGLSVFPLYFCTVSLFFRAFNSTGIYETFLKSSPRFYGFVVIGGMAGTFYWSRMWDHIWNPVNQGKLYAHSPYVYPPAGDGE